MKRYRFLILNVLLGALVLGAMYGRRMEASTAGPGDFLRGFTAPYRNWKTRDIALTAGERNLLQPDATLVRQYEGGADGGAELAIIAGHRKRSVHTPGFCMAGGGYEQIWVRDEALKLPTGDIPAVHSLQTREGQNILVTYFFTDGDFNTRSLVQYQQFQLMKRLRHRCPEGALVRIIVPIQNSEAQSEAIMNDFARAVVPAVLNRIKAATAL